LRHETDAEEGGGSMYMYFISRWLSLAPSSGYVYPPGESFADDRGSGRQVFERGLRNDTSPHSFTDIYRAQGVQSVPLLIAITVDW